LQLFVRLDLPRRVGLFDLVAPDDGQCGADAGSRKKSLPVASLEETTDPDDETGGPRKDIGAPDLRLSGAVDGSIWNVQLRSCAGLPDGVYAS